MRRSIAGRPWSVPLAAGALLWFLAAPFATTYLSPSLVHVDWTTYANAAQRFVNGEPLYNAIQTTVIYRGVDVVTNGFLYPPPAILVFVLAQPSGRMSDAGQWRDPRHRSVGRHAGDALGLEPSGWSCSQIRPYLEGAQIGNVNVALAGLLAWSWALGRRQQVAVLAGIAALIKVFPGLLVAWSRPFRRSVIVATATATVVVLVTLPIIGVGVWLDYASAAQNLAPTCEMAISPIACTIGKPGTIILAGALALGATTARY